MPNAIASNNGHRAFIFQMRKVRKVLFNCNTPMGYDTPDSDEEEQVFSFMIGVIGLVSGDISGAEDDAEVEDEDEETDTDSEADENFVDPFPLPTFQLLPDEGDADGNRAELEFALWIHLQELRIYRNYLRGLWEKRAQGSQSPTLLTLLTLNRLVVMLVSASQMELEQSHPLLERAEYDRIMGTLSDSHRNDEEDAPDLDRMESDPGQLTAQFCRWRTKQLALDRGHSRRDIPGGNVFQSEVVADIVRLDQATPHPLRHLRKVTRRIVASVEEWIDEHDPSFYGRQTTELVSEMNGLLAHAKTIFDGDRRLSLQSDPVSRALEEVTLFRKSWAIGKKLITDASRHRYLATVMSLYLHLRENTNIQAIDTLEYLNKFLTGLSDNVLSFPEDPDSMDFSDPQDSPLEWATKYEFGNIAVLALDGFTIERMAFAVLDRLHGSCQRILQPYMMRVQSASVTSPGYVGLVQCFIDAWENEPPRKVQILGEKGYKALQHGLASIKYINPKLIFLQ
ncbi:hypothetical protein C8R43DRAFT_1012804 [Mycena crocata]|nr:hypothetical protein C8R43DRAFT_1012804 [Mycena crocata]